jgi:hypothetical protein
MLETSPPWAVEIRFWCVVRFAAVAKYEDALPPRLSESAAFRVYPTDTILVLGERDSPSMDISRYLVSEENTEELIAKDSPRRTLKMPSLTVTEWGSETAADGHILFPPAS